MDQNRVNNINDRRYMMVTANHQNDNLKCGYPTSNKSLSTSHNSTTKSECLQSGDVLLKNRSLPASFWKEPNVPKTSLGKTISSVEYSSGVPFSEYYTYMLLMNHQSYLKSQMDYFPRENLTLSYNMHSQLNYLRLAESLNSISMTSLRRPVPIVFSDKPFEFLPPQIWTESINKRYINHKNNNKKELSSRFHPYQI